MTEFKQGEMIEVSYDNGLVWFRRKFIVLHRGVYYCESNLEPDSSLLVCWEKARPITEPEIVPYTFETIPMQVIWARGKGITYSYCLVEAFFLDGVKINGEFLLYKELLEAYEISLDGMKTWQAAGVESGEI